MYTPRFAVNNVVTLYGKKCWIKSFYFNPDNATYYYNLIDETETNRQKREVIIPNVPQDQID